MHDLMMALCKFSCVNCRTLTGRLCNILLLSLLINLIVISCLFYFSTAKYSICTSPPLHPYTNHLYYTVLLLIYTTPAWTYLCLSSGLTCRSAESCCMRDNNTGCWRGQGICSNTWDGFTVSHTNITRLRSDADRACRHREEIYRNIRPISRTWV